MITCLVHRAYKICSSLLEFENEMSNLRNYFSGNRYPQYLFDQFLSKYLHNIQNPKPITLTVPKFEMYMKLPYLGQNCTKDLKSLISKFYPRIRVDCRAFSA